MSILTHVHISVDEALAGVADAPCTGELVTGYVEPPSAAAASPFSSSSSSFCAASSPTDVLLATGGPSSAAPVGGRSSLAGAIRQELLSGDAGAKIEPKRRAQYSLSVDQLCVGNLIRIFQVHPPQKGSSGGAAAKRRRKAAVAPDAGIGGVAAASGGSSFSLLFDSQSSALEDSGGHGGAPLAPPMPQRFLARCAFNILVLPERFLPDGAEGAVCSEGNPRTVALVAFLRDANEAVQFTDSALNAPFLPPPMLSEDEERGAERGVAAAAGGRTACSPRPTAASPPSQHPCGGPLFLFVVGRSAKARLASAAAAQWLADVLVLHHPPVAAVRAFSRAADAAREVVQLARYVQEGKIDKHRAVLATDDVKGDADPCRVYRAMLSAVDGFGDALAHSVMLNFPTFGALLTAVHNAGSREEFAARVGSLATDQAESHTKRIGPANAAKLFDALAGDHRQCADRAFAPPTSSRIDRGLAAASPPPPPCYGGGVDTAEPPEAAGLLAAHGGASQSRGGGGGGGGGGRRAAGAPRAVRGGTTPTLAPVRASDSPTTGKATEAPLPGEDFLSW